MRGIRLLISRHELSRFGRRVGSHLSVLSERPFRLLWIARTVSAAGDAMLPAAVAFAVLGSGGSASDIGLVLGASVSSQLALTLIGGVWADRLPRRLVVLACNLLQAATLAGVAVLLLTGTVRTLELVMASVTYGAASAFVLPALTGLVAETASPSRLQQANAFIGLSRNVGYTAGPAAGGVLAAIAGAAGVYLVDALACAVAVVSLAALRLPVEPRRKENSFLRDMMGGWRELAIRPWYLLNICAHGLWNFAITAFWVLGPIIATRDLGGPAAWGAIAAGGTVGSFIGVLAALRWIPGRPLVWANLALGLSALELLALVQPSPLGVVILAAMVSAVGLTFLNVAWATTMQQIIPDRILSRVSSCDWLISLTPMPVGYALAGPVGQAVGLGTTLVVASIVLAAPCVLVVLLPGIRRVRRLPGGRIVDGSDAADPGLVRPASRDLVQDRPS